MVKKVMTKSSIESATAISAAPMTVGWMIGSVTVMKARSGEAPRSRALSTTRQSKLEHARVDDDDDERLREEEVAEDHGAEAERQTDGDVES